jgi:hypothetical protein
MPNWKKVIVSGSAAVLSSVTASFTGSLTGALIGTSSWATAALNAQLADSASYIATVRNTTTAVFYPTFVDTNNSVRTPEDLFTSNLITFNPGTSTFGAFNISGSSIFAIAGFTGSLQGTASWAVSASQALTASRATSASYALSASYAPGGGSAFPYVGAAVITGSLIVSGTYGGINTFVNKPNLFDINGITRVQWSNGCLNNTAGDTTLDWEINNLIDSAATTVLDWENKILYDSAGANSIDWTNRTLSETTNAWVALEYSDDTYLNSQLYYRNVVPAQVQRSIANAPTSKYGGQIIQAAVDAGVTDFQLVYLDTDGTWYPTEAAVAYGADKMLGICVDQANGYVLIEGDIGVSDDNSQGAYVIGADHGLPVYVSATTGVMTVTAPSGAGKLVRIVGHIYYQSSTDANWWTMKFRPSNEWYEI